MARKSTKALNEFLATLGEPPCGSFETYGRDTKAYVFVPKTMTRAQFEAKLTEAGFTCHPEWNRTIPTGTEVDVTFRKVKGWDE